MARHAVFKNRNSRVRPAKAQQARFQPSPQALDERRAAVGITKLDGERRIGLYVKSRPLEVSLTPCRLLLACLNVNVRSLISMLMLSDLFYLAAVVSVWLAS
jgi:hypothetical protein